MDSIARRRILFIGCFVALVATSFGFISRVFMLGEWGEEFSLSDTQKGEIFGAGLWPFAISIVLFSLVIDRVGYGKAMVFALVTHTASAIMTIFATGYDSLYWAAFVGALGNGTIEAVINPVIATVYSKEKTLWLNVLHAGWPAGLVLAGILTIALDTFGVGWQAKCALLLLPVAIYGLLLLKMQFPVNERVAAGVPYLDMLKEPGALGIFIVAALIIVELGRVMTSGDETPFMLLIGSAVIVAILYGIRVKSLGRPLYVFMLLIMLLLATTELGTDGWIKELMQPAMDKLQIDGGWILIYTASIMAALRFMTGPILLATGLSPLGLLSVSCVLVISGMVWLSTLTDAGPLVILLAAGIYGAGQTFFWPTTLGFIAERFPRGGALTLNAIAGVGMLGVGILGAPWLGYVQDSSIDAHLAEQEPLLHQQIIASEPKKLWGVLDYRPVDNERVAALTPLKVSADSIKAKLKMTLANEEQLDAQLLENRTYTGIINSAPYKEEEATLARLAATRDQAKRDALFEVAILPLLMLVSYLGLLLYFRSKGGYRAIELSDEG